ncbi:MAG: glycosyltransferase family 2 protein [Pseudomonadota bacterium]
MPSNLGSRGVSICIPTYNGQEYLQECLDSILIQTYPDTEILIVDDCSTDDTVRIVEEYAIRDNRIRLIKNEQNLGLVGNWNRCIELAQGEWIKFVFQDDLIAPTCLEKMLSAATAQEKPIVFCRREFIFDSTTDVETRFHYNAIPLIDQLSSGEENIPSQQARAMVLQETRNFFGEPTSVLIHRSVFRRFGAFNPHLAQLCDLEYWIRVTVNTGLAYVPESLAQFRFHPASTSAANRAAKLFRSDLLDRLVLLHEYAYNPLYAPLRTAAQKLNPPRNFAREFARRADWAKAVALAACTDKARPDTGPISEWNQLAMVYPRLNWTIHQTPHKVRRWLDRTVLWRFRSHEKS